MITGRTSREIPNNLKQNKFESFFNPKDFWKVQEEVLPRKLLVLTTNICNANCVFCGYQYKEDKHLTMSNELFDRVTEQYAKMHPHSYVSLTPTVGDPLVDQSIFEKVAIAKRNGIKRVQFYTNALLLKKRLHELLESPLDHLELSLADFNEEEYFRIYRVKGYHRVIEGISLLLQEHKKRNSNLSIDINLRGRRPLSEMKAEPDFKNHIEPYLSDLITFSAIEEYDNWAGLIKQEDLPEGMNLRPDTKEINKKPCTRLFDLQALPDGQIRLCGCRFNKTVNDELVIGSIDHQPLEDIWFGDRAKKVRNRFFDGDYPEICKKCSFYGPVGEKRFYVKDLDRVKSNFLMQ